VLATIQFHDIPAFSNNTVIHFIKNKGTKPLINSTVFHQKDIDSQQVWKFLSYCGSRTFFAMVI